MKKKEKIKFNENVKFDESIDDLKDFDVINKVIETGYFEEVTKDLSEEEKKQVLKESKTFLKKYENFVHQFAKVLETPEGKEKFVELARKKFGAK